MKKDDLKKRSFLFSLRLVKLVSQLPNSRIYWVLGDQLLRAGTSIGANIIEAQAASSRRDFIRFYEIALKSANETKYWLELLEKGTGVAKEELKLLLREATELANILAASLLTLKGKRKL